MDSTDEITVASSASLSDGNSDTPVQRRSVVRYVRPTPHHPSGPLSLSLSIVLINALYLRVKLVGFVSSMKCSVIEEGRLAQQDVQVEEAGQKKSSVS